MNNNSNNENSFYWNQRYSNDSDIWTLNKPNPVFVHLLEQNKFNFKNKLLIPGCGKSLDPCFAANKGYDVTAIDISEKALDYSKALCPKTEPVRFLNRDILELKNFGEKFDWIYEYVTFCSFPQDMLESIISNFYSVLNDGGYLVTNLFPIARVEVSPPFLIDWKNFINLAKKFFKLLFFQKNINSIKPRLNNEILLIFKKYGSENG